jgi:hypothetical protein
MSRGNGVKGHTRSGADDESRTRGLDRGVVVLCLLSYIRKNVQDRPSASTEVVLQQVVKELSPVAHRRRGRDPSIAGLRQCAGRLKSESKKARILVRSGPLRTEIRGCASMRCPLPDAPGPRPDQADSLPAGSDAVRSRNRRTTSSSPRHARTRPSPSWVGWL